MEDVGLSYARWSNLNFKLTLSLTDLLRVPDLGLLSTYLIPKCPSASVKPVNQLLSPKLEVSNKPSAISKEYLILKDVNNKQLK